MHPKWLFGADSQHRSHSPIQNPRAASAFAVASPLCEINHGVRRFKLHTQNMRCGTVPLLSKTRLFALLLLLLDTDLDWLKAVHYKSATYSFYGTINIMTALKYMCMLFLLSTFWSFHWIRIGYILVIYWTLQMENYSFKFFGSFPVLIYLCLLSPLDYDATLITTLVISQIDFDLFK